MRSPGLHNHRVLRTRPPLLHPWYWPCRPWYSSSPRQSWTRRSQIWRKKSLYLYFKKFIDIFIFIYFINKFCAIFLPRPGHQGQAQEHPDGPGEGLAHGCCTVGVPSRKACRALVGGLGAQARARARMITPAALITFHKLVVHLTSIVGEVSTFTFRDCLIFMFWRLSNFSFH